VISQRNGTLSRIGKPSARAASQLLQRPFCLSEDAHDVRAKTCRVALLSSGERRAQHVDDECRLRPSQNVLSSCIHSTCSQNIISPLALSLSLSLSLSLHIAHWLHWGSWTACVLRLVLKQRPFRKTGTLAIEPNWKLVSGSKHREPLRGSGNITPGKCFEIVYANSYNLVHFWRERG